MWRINGDGLVAPLSIENLEYIVAGSTLVERGQITQSHTDVNSSTDYSLRESYSRFMRTSILNIEDALYDVFWASGSKNLVGYILVKYLRSEPPFFMSNGYNSFMLSASVDAYSYCRNLVYSTQRSVRTTYEHVVSDPGILALWKRIEARTDSNIYSWELNGEDIVYAEE